MNLITVDHTKCTKCGICIEECPVIVLQMSDKGPEARNPRQCIACGHCVAVCPQTAINNALTPMDQQSAIAQFPELTKESAEQFLRSRRSIRSYKKTPVQREQLQQLVEIARYAPTGCNVQGISYIIVEDRKVVEKAADITRKWLEQNGADSSFKTLIDTFKEKGIDTILRSAPHLILAISALEFQQGRENTIFSLAYMELYATALGLGSCWAGIFEMCAFSGYEPLLSLFNIPEGKRITGAVMVGYPKYRYKRRPERNPLEIIYI